MFLESRRWYDRHGAQRTAGPFLWVVLPDEPAENPCKECSSLRTRKMGYERYCYDCSKQFYDKLYHPPFTEARAFVRHVKMEQCGHWMMGKIKVGKHEQTVSGTYGADGLPDEASRHVWEAGMGIPKEIMETWANSESGHNSAGDEALSIYAWAKENINALRRVGREL